MFTSASRNIIPSMALELLSAIVGRINDFCGCLDEEILRNNFVLIYELIDEIMDFGHPQFTDPETLKRFVTSNVEKTYSSALDYIYSQIQFDKLRIVDSVSERESEKSIQKPTHDMFVEVNEKLSA